VVQLRGGIFWQPDETALVGEFQQLQPRISQTQSEAHRQSNLLRPASTALDIAISKRDCAVIRATSQFVE
jgi:hypothetical protein